MSDDTPSHSENPPPGPAASGPCGFVTITGRTNVGKSTLLNRLVGTKTAIRSDKAQTTRQWIRGVLTRDDGQVIFVDTPGIHKPKHPLGEHLRSRAFESWEEADVILFVVEATAAPGGGDRFISERLRDVTPPIVTVLNKVDLVDSARVPKRVDQYRELGPWQETLPVSARTGKGTDRLVEVLIDLLPEGPFLYPADQVRDQPEHVFFGELIREKALHHTREEVPHAIAVRVDRVEPGDDPHVLVVEATLFVERESQKGIVIGKKGHMLRTIGSAARKELERLLDQDVYLDLHVKVLKNWRRNEAYLRDLGFAT